MYDQKIRVLAIERILCETPLTADQIMDRLETEYGITCDRKTIYKDISALMMFYPNLYCRKPKYGGGYFLVNDFSKWEKQLKKDF